MIRIDCYLAKLKSFRKIYPDAHFEVITRTAHSILSPSWGLLNRAKKGGLTFKEYEELLVRQLIDDPKAVTRMKQLKKLSESTEVFLICYERDSSVCHRSTVKKLIEEMI